MTSLRELIDFYYYGRHRLEAIELLPLGSKVSDASALYGVPFESEPSDETPEITVHSFQVGSYHEAVAMEWQNCIRSITYWSAKGDPGRDLDCMLDFYKGDSHWSVLEKGYWYQRDDGHLKLWCSAIPAIGVADVEFLSAKARLERENDFKKLDELTDATWAPDHIFEDLQRRCVTGEDTKLRDIAGRSDRIAVSDDGRHLFIVREHHGYDIEDTFMVLNGPPKDRGYPVQVIHLFWWVSEDLTRTHSTVLPKDAAVESNYFEGNICHVKIRRVTTGQTISLSKPASEMHSLSIGRLVQRNNNEDLWAALEAAAGK
jgi:hypothetical protein